MGGSFAALLLFGLAMAAALFLPFLLLGPNLAAVMPPLRSAALRLAVFIVLRMVLTAAFFALPLALRRMVFFVGVTANEMLFLAALRGLALRAAFFAFAALGGLTTTGTSTTLAGALTTSMWLLETGAAAVLFMLAAPGKSIAKSSSPRSLYLLRRFFLLPQNTMRLPGVPMRGIASVL